MRILVLSNVDESIDVLLDHVDLPNANIVTKDVKGSAQTLAERAAQLLKNGSYDYALVIPDDSIGASIYLNKIDGVRCAVCRTGGDVEKAREHDANTIIVERAEPESLNEIVGTMAKRGGIGFKFPKLPRPVLEMPKRAEPAQQPIQKPRKPEPRQQEYEEPARSSPKGKRKGIGGMFKDYLGIVD